MNTIEVSKRDFSRNAKQLRKAGFIPGSVFGGPLSESVSLQIDLATAKKLVDTKHIGSQMQLKLDDKTLLVQLKQKNVNMLNHEIQNIDFQALKADQKVNSVAHILLENTDKVTAVLEHRLLEIPYAALPEDMIDTIAIDVDGMPVGTAVTVADIKELQSDKIELTVSPEELVFRITDKKFAAAAEEEEGTEASAEA